MRRAQSSLEYLTTYGWGLLAVLVAIGALAAFGFLSPNRYLPASCEMGSQLLCTDYALYAAGASDNGYFDLQLQNGFGEAINITGVWIVPNAPAQVQLLPTLGVLPTAGTRLSAGNTTLLRATIPINGPVSLARGERESVPIRVTFRRDAEGSTAHNVTGVVFATVQ
jgi:hypothetical protein